MRLTTITTKPLLAVAMLLACFAARAAAESCPGISAETAQRLFDHAKSVRLGAGYRFEGVSTTKSELLISWSLHGEACPPMRVGVENCGSMFGLASLQLHVPPQLRPLPGPPQTYARWMQDCATIRDRVRGAPVEEIDVPARKMSLHDFMNRTVHLGLYRLQDASICTLGPRGRS